MSHKSIRLLIEATAKGLQDDINYTYGTETDFNQDKKRAFSFIHCDPLSAVPAFRSNNGTTNYMKQWTAQMAFVKIDTKDSPPEKYALILDAMDDLIDSFVTQLNYFQSQSDDLIISSVTQSPAIKTMADILTGYTLTIQFLVNDNFDYCVNC